MAYLNIQYISIDQIRLEWYIRQIPVILGDFQSLTLIIKTVAGLGRFR